ncbi:MAG: putative motility protein [Bacillota bacterium]
MKVSGMYNSSINSVQQALSTATLQNAMNQDASTVNTLLESLDSSSRQQLESSVAPNKGGKINTWA